LAIGGGEWSDSHSGHLIPGKRSPPPTLHIFRLLELQSSLDAVVKRKSPMYLPGIKLWAYSS